MDQLMEHTLQRQLAEQAAEQAATRTILAAQAAQLNDLTQMVKQKQVAGGGQVNNGPINNGPINNGPVTNNHITIMPWDEDKRVNLEVAQVIAAFAENRKAQEYLSIGDHEQADPEIAPPYITDLMMELVRRAHADPAAAERITSTQAERTKCW
jgi:hypothetical protein